jgi:hypothetical protein
MTVAVCTVLGPLRGMPDGYACVRQSEVLAGSLGVRGAYWAWL